jgi:hypothetical protein
MAVLRSTAYPAGGSSQGSVVRVVGNVPTCVPGGGDASLADLQIGIDNVNHYVVLIRQIVQCARSVGERAAQTACQNCGSDMALHLGHGDALGMAMWGKHNQCTCNVWHVAAVLEWAVEGYGGINVLATEQRAGLVAAVHKTACDHAAIRLKRARDAMTDSIGFDIVEVDTELNGVREEASGGSTALAAAHSELAEEVRLRTQLQQHLIDLKAELQGAQEELAHMHAPGLLVLVEEDASMNETQDQVI